MVSCRECGVNLSMGNWYESQRKINSKICKGCMRKKSRDVYRKMSESKRKDIRVKWREKNPEYFKEYYKVHSDEIKKTTKEFFTTRKLKLIRMLGGKCQKCGYCENFSALVFHHVKPEEKERDDEWLRRDFDQKIKAGKIMLLCANCHQELHCPNCNLRKVYKSVF